MYKFTKDEVDSILEKLSDEERKFNVKNIEDSGEVELDVTKFLIAFANKVHEHLGVESMEKRIKLLEQEVAWAENGYKK